MELVIPRVVDFLLIAVASWRIATLMAGPDEGGPFGILDKIRNTIGVKYSETSEMYGTNVLSRMWICYYCNSFWIGVVLTVFLLINEYYTAILLAPFAISGAVILIQSKL